MNYVLGRLGVKAAWAIMDAGEAIVRFAERLEALSAGPGTALCAFSWRMMSVGERVQALGVAAASWVERQAKNLGCNLEYLMSDILAEA
jgi:hypothetical protein